MDTKKMRECSSLLPDPGGEVVRKCLDEIERLTAHILELENELAAGVHTGVLVSAQGEQVILRDSRRLWRWQAKAGVALSGVAQTGLASRCKVDTENPEIALSGVIEIIPCSQAAEESIRGY